MRGKYEADQAPRASPLCQNCHTQQQVRENALCHPQGRAQALCHAIVQETDTVNQSYNSLIDDTTDIGKKVNDETGVASTTSEIFFTASSFPSAL